MSTTLKVDLLVKIETRIQTFQKCVTGYRSLHRKRGLW